MKLKSINKLSGSLSIILIFLLLWYIYSGYVSYDEWNILLFMSILFGFMIIVNELIGVTGIFKLVIYLSPSLVIILLYWLLILMDNSPS